MNSNKLIAEGAEAKIYFQGDEILKSRIEKGYRHPVLDEKIRKGRTKREAKILGKALESGIKVPKVLEVTKYDMKIEYIEGDRLSETLNNYEEDKQFKVMKDIGHEVSLLHSNDIIHGDLTTSNTLLKEGEVFIIDFGLGFVSTKIEDMAVDLHLIKQALEAKHYMNHEKLFAEFLKGYKWEETEKVLERLKAVEKRGRYRH